MKDLKPISFRPTASEMSKIEKEMQALGIVTISTYLRYKLFEAVNSNHVNGLQVEQRSKEHLHTEQDIDGLQDVRLQEPDADDEFYDEQDEFLDDEDSEDNEEDEQETEERLQVVPPVKKKARLQISTPPANTDIQHRQECNVPHCSDRCLQLKYPIISHPTCEYLEDSGEVYDAIHMAPGSLHELIAQVSISTGKSKVQLYRLVGDEQVLLPCGTYEYIKGDRAGKFEKHLREQFKKRKTDVIYAWLEGMPVTLFKVNWNTLDLACYESIFKGMSYNEKLRLCVEHWHNDYRKEGAEEWPLC